MYSIEVRLANKRGFHTPAEARAHYGRYARDGVTIHWWNTPQNVKDSDHDNIVNYMLGRAAKGEASVNYVVSNKKITMLVNPDNVAWASQSGNPTTVSIECSPHLNAEGYKRVGWLVNQLFNPKNGRYRRNPKMYQHKDWFQTVCSGTVSKTRVGAEAKKWADGGYNPKPAPKPTPAPTPKPPAKLNDKFILWKDGGAYVTNKQPTKLYDLTNAKDWSTVKTSKTFKKGEVIDIVGSFYNNALKREYYITRYSFDKKLATGFHPDDLDIYVPPRPVPKPPETKPNPPVEPTDPAPSTPTPDTIDKNMVIAFLESIIKVVQEFITKIKK